MQASIIIVNWNGRELLQRGLPSVIKAVQASKQDHEVIVVDDCSQDDSVAVVHCEFPMVKVIALAHNGGFGAACNAGVRASIYPIVVMLNNDMIVDEKFLDCLLQPLADNRVFAVACQIRKWDQQTIEIGRTWGEFRLGFLKPRRTDGNEALYEQPVPCLYASGGAVAYDREKYLQLGGFNELFNPFYWEDTDLSYRAWKRGWKVLYQPHSVVFHKHQGTIGRLFNKRFVKMINYRNRFLFMWSNITDRKCIRQHLLLLLPYLVITTLIFQWHYLKGFLLALYQLSDALRKRRQEVAYQELSDQQVLLASRVMSID